MVFCCGPLNCLEPETESVTNSKGGANLYPGQRRNQVIPADSGALPVEQDGEQDLVSVTVPPGVYPGQTIAVLAPDGSRQVKATVPPGLGPGSTFLVRLAKPLSKDIVNAPHIQPQQPNFAGTLDAWLTPTPDTPPNDKSSSSPNKFFAETNSVVEAVATPMHDKHQQQSSSSPHRVSGEQVHGDVEPVGNQGDAPPPQQKLLLVHVPPGLMPGSTIQVEVPGEDRTLTAQVPPNATSFHVAYSPRVRRPPMTKNNNHYNNPRPAASHAQPPQQQQQTRPFAEHASNNSKQQRRQQQQQNKLLLVRVPPGTAPGTTLHVSVPDEPGRILAAKVPAGNVQEFHVSYEPRKPKTSSSSPSYPQRIAYTSNSQNPYPPISTHQHPSGYNNSQQQHYPYHQQGGFDY